MPNYEACFDNSVLSLGILESEASVRLRLTIFRGCDSIYFSRNNTLTKRIAMSKILFISNELKWILRLLGRQILKTVSMSLL